MNDHRFSNQKSALEDYFESLLAEDDSEENTAAKQPETVTAKEKAEYIEASTTVVEQTGVSGPDAETTSEAIVSESGADEDTVSKITVSKEAVKEKLTEQARRTSVEEMLASVEEKLQEEKAAEEMTTKLDFAEPAPVIPIPLPEVTPPVVEPEGEVEEAITEQVELEQQQPVEEVAEQVAEQQAVVPVSTEPPEWAEQPFQCLLFNVGGLALAVPLVRLNGVIPWSENIVETPNQTDWYLGVLMNHGNKVQVIDTAVMVLPPEHRVDLPAGPEERFSHILLVDDQRWGLACDSIGDVVWIKKDDVKWRSNKTKRPWLLGTAIEHMCAVMDTEAFADMLQDKK